MFSNEIENPYFIFVPICLNLMYRRYKYLRYWKFRVNNFTHQFLVDYVKDIETFHNHVFVQNVDYVHCQYILYLGDGKSF